MERRSEKKDDMFRPAVAKRQDWELAVLIDWIEEGNVEVAVGVGWTVEGMSEAELEVEAASLAEGMVTSGVWSSLELPIAGVVSCRFTKIYINWISGLQILISSLIIPLPWLSIQSRSSDGRVTSTLICMSSWPTLGSSNSRAACKNS